MLLLCKRCVAVVKCCGAVVKHCVAVVKRWIQDRELAGLTTASKCCALEQDILSALLGTGFYAGRPAHNTHKRVSQYTCI